MAKYYSTTLQKGSKGDEVKEWQQFLNSQGYSLGVDGDFGDKTYAATTEWQRKNGLGADGIVGKNTWGKAGYSLAPSNTDFDYKDFTYDDFSYDDYKESDTVKNAGAALDTHLANKPGEYNSQWRSQLDELMNNIMNREDFSYNFNEDALYQQYKDKYIQQGKMAMADTMGQAAAMTGGYGNSYAQSVGQQAYQGQLDNLNDVIPELYQMALDRYNREGQDMYNQYGMLADRENLDYSRYRDTVSDFLTERDYLTGRYDSERDYDYSKYNNERDFAYNQYSSDRALDYDKYSSDRALSYDEYRAAIADEQWQKQYDTEEAWRQKEWDYQTSQDTLNRTENNAKTYHETGGKVGYNNGALSDAQVKELQKVLGVNADGKWGSGSTEAAGGLTADQAWKAYQDGKLGKADVSYEEIEDDLNYFISQGADKSEINNYLREALKSGYITQSEYNELKELYAPRGQVY